MYVSLDGTLVQIIKFKNHFHWIENAFALTYEIGLNIKNGDIVWVNGSFTAGEFLDLKIAQLTYVHMIKDGEMYLADDGYKDPYFIYPWNNNHSKTSNGSS